MLTRSFTGHDDVIKWKHFPRYWPFVRGIQRSPVNSPHKDQWRGALKFSLICARINRWVNNREAGDLGRHQAHCDVIVMKYSSLSMALDTTMEPENLCRNSAHFRMRFRWKKAVSIWTKNSLEVANKSYVQLHGSQHWSRLCNGGPGPCIIRIFPC